ncbi:MAG: Trk system potassium transporter TrkA [Candidatus Puniceispirillaceae bacterium]
MKIIVCGAGIVGSAISEHLAHEGNDVTVIDSDAEKIQRITEHADVGAVMGVASHPDVLAQAGLAETDLIIAVTDSDEVNMVACQVAHTIFETPTKISRIRSNAYLSSQAQLLYASNNIAIDHIISPEREVSRAVGRQLQLPGAFDVKEMAGGRIRLIGVQIEANCAVLATPLRHLTTLFPDLSLTIVAIMRSGALIVPRDGRDMLEEGDRVYFVVDADHVERAMATFGHTEEEAASVVIAGGGNIGQMVAEELVAEGKVTPRIIEINKEQARNLAKQVPASSVICGDMLDSDILKEAGVRATGTFVAVSDDDEVNILSALLAKRMGAKHTVALVSMPGFVPLISTLGVDAVINPPQITISSLLEHVRRGRIHDVHSVSEGAGEVLEAEALATSSIVGKPLRNSRIPKGVAIGAVVRGERVIPARGDTIIEDGDRVIVFARKGSSKKAENIITAKDDIFT